MAFLSYVHNICFHLCWKLTFYAYCTCYRLEEPIMHLLWGLVEGFFSVLSPQTWTDLDETRNISEGSCCTLNTKNSGEIAPGVARKDAKTCFVFFLSPIQRELSATYPAPILTAYEIKDVTWCVHAYTGKNSKFTCRGFYRFPKQLKIGTFEEVFVIRLQLKQHNFGQWESFRGLVDIPRMCLLWVMVLVL